MVHGNGALVEDLSVRLAARSVLSSPRGCSRTEAITSSIDGPRADQDKAWIDAPSASACELTEVGSDQDAVAMGTTVAAQASSPLGASAER